MNVIVVGCGRVGVELALTLSEQHGVTVIDRREEAFDRLGPDFPGRTVQGQGLDHDVLQRAGAEEADALAAVTASDSVNLVVGKVARDRFHIRRVVARTYNPGRSALYQTFGLDTVASSSWGAQRIVELLLHGDLPSVYGVGHGEVQVYEVTVTDGWSGRPLADLLPEDESRAVALVRSGGAFLPRADTRLLAGDVVHVSATPAGAEIVRARVQG
jgi:trk system potassium uptake protein TrkA